MKQLNKNSFYKLPILDGLELLDAMHHTLNFPFHTHQTYNITLVVEMNFATRLQDRLLQAPAGSIVITHPGEVHSSICDNKIGSSFFTFYVPPDVLSTLNNQQPVFFDNKTISDPVLFRQLYLLSRNINSAGAGIEKVLLPALKKLVSQYATATGFIPHKSNTRFQRFLGEETFEKFSLTRTAAKFGLNKYKFLRLFKHETGLTPNNYIILKRIEKSKQLLQTQDDLLGIAIETGFYDATHFCRHFKKFTGITPLAYHNA